jgi:hypothetical protein
MTPREYLQRAEDLLSEAEVTAPGSPFRASVLAELATASATVAALQLLVAVVDGRIRDGDL